MVHHPESAIRNSGFPPSFRRRSEPELRRARRFPSSVSELRFQVSSFRFLLSRSQVSGFTLVELPAVICRKTAVRGFTLVELMTVIAIIAILAGMILGVSGYATRKADKSRAIADMEKIKGALEDYRLQYGSYPSVSGSMTNPAFATTRLRLTNTMQNAVSDLNFTDPWGNSYSYSNYSRFVYSVSSVGPDSTDPSGRIMDGKMGQ